MTASKKKKRKLPTGPANDAPEISLSARQEFVGGAQVHTSDPSAEELVKPSVEKLTTNSKKAPMKPRMFRFAEEDDDRLAGLINRLDLARVRPIPTGADIVRAGLYALENYSDEELVALFTKIAAIRDIP